MECYTIRSHKYVEYIENGTEISFKQFENYIITKFKDLEIVKNYIKDVYEPRENQTTSEISEELPF